MFVIISGGGVKVKRTWMLGQAAAEQKTHL